MVASHRVWQKDTTVFLPGIVSVCLYLKGFFTLLVFTVPYLQFEINQKVESPIKAQFATEIRDALAEIMNTGTDHIAVSIEEYGKYDLTIAESNFNVGAEKQYVTFTEHPGTDFHLVEKYLARREANEDPVADEADPSPLNTYKAASPHMGNGLR